MPDKCPVLLELFSQKACLLIFSQTCETVNLKKSVIKETGRNFFIPIVFSFV